MDDISQYFEINEWIEVGKEEMPVSTPIPQGVHNPQYALAGGSQGDSGEIQIFVFRTKSPVEVLDDGFRWRKYGKKTVKSNPNPRNYYKCSVPGCFVKKRIQRDNEDPKYIVTTYEGTHNHISSRS